jgi:hypothetical protein
MITDVGDLVETDLGTKSGDVFNTPTPVRPRTVRDDHDVEGCLPTTTGETPIETPLLVVTLEQDNISPLAHLVNKVGLKIPHTAVDRVRFDHDRPIVKGVQEIQKPFIPISVPPVVIVFIKPVFMLNVNRIGFQAGDLFGHGLPPIPS